MGKPSYDQQTYNGGYFDAMNDMKYVINNHVESTTLSEFLLKQIHYLTLAQRETENG